MTGDDKERAPGAEQPADPPAPDSVAEAPAAEDRAAQLERELAELKDKYLRLAAEFDNFRKRAVKERAEVWMKAQADLVQRLVDALDDLGRFAHVDPVQTDAKTIHDGVDLVERKFWKELEAVGVRRIDESGVPFDPARHEAVTTQAAQSSGEDHTVGAVLQAGYLLGDYLIRPARVIVLTWEGEAEG